MWASISFRSNSDQPSCPTPRSGNRRPWDLNIHRDTFRDQRLCLLNWVPREHARRFLELASNLVDYRTVDLDVPPFSEETSPGK